MSQAAVATALPVFASSARCQRAGRAYRARRRGAAYPRGQPHGRGVGRRPSLTAAAPSVLSCITSARCIRWRSTRRRCSRRASRSSLRRDLGEGARDQRGASRAHAHVTKSEALLLLQKNSTLAAAAIRALGDEELDRAAPASLYGNAPITCQFMLEDHAVPHSYHHLAKIREMLGLGESNVVR